MLVCVIINAWNGICNRYLFQHAHKLKTHAMNTGKCLPKWSSTVCHLFTNACHLTLMPVGNKCDTVFHVLADVWHGEHNDTIAIHDYNQCIDNCLAAVYLLYIKYYPNLQNKPYKTTMNYSSWAKYRPWHSLWKQVYSKLYSGTQKTLQFSLSTINHLSWLCVKSGSCVRKRPGQRFILTHLWPEVHSQHWTANTCFSEQMLCPIENSWKTHGKGLDTIHNVNLLYSLMSTS